MTNAQNVQKERPDPQITALVARIRARELRITAELMYEFGDESFAIAARFLMERADKIESDGMGARE